MKKLISASLLALTAFTTLGLNFNDSEVTGLILLGDTGKDNQGQLEVSQSIQELCSREKCDLGINAGDIVYQEGVTSANDPILETMFDKYYNSLNFPFLIALGNHDYGKYSRDWKRGSYQLLHAKKNPAFYLPNYFYTYETKEAVFAVLDTSRLMWKKDVEIQARMVEEARLEAETQKKWFMVIGHHPYLSNGKHGNAGNYERLPFPYFVSGKYVKKFIERYICGKADFYLSGHEHSLQVIDGNIANCDTQLIVSGSGASASKLFERNKVEFEKSIPGYFHLLMTRESVTVKAYDSSTELLFEKIYRR